MVGMQTHKGSVAIVGAGIAGLSIGWELQRRNFTVSLFDPRGVAGGASWGNAGWITPSLALPLTSPDLLKQGIKSWFKRGGPIKAPKPYRPRSATFLGRLALNSTNAMWDQNCEALGILNKEALGRLEKVAEQVHYPLEQGAYTAAFTNASAYKSFYASLQQKIG